MAKSYNQKLKLLRLMEIFRKYSDEENKLTLAQITEHLAFHEIQANRKTLYEDIGLLDEDGFGIPHQKNQRHYYHQRNKDTEFELSELKLIYDAVQSSKFITQAATDRITKKLKGLCSTYEARELQGKMYVVNRIKNMNESVLPNVEAVRKAIQENRQIGFKYFNYDIKGKREYLLKGERYTVSPFSLIYSENNYYLLAYQVPNGKTKGKFKHFRIDKMERIFPKTDSRIGIEEYAAIDRDTYLRNTFSMYGGELQKVTLQFSNHLAGVVIDRFGRDVNGHLPMASPVDNGHFQIRVDVAVSNQFFGWVLGLGKGVKIVDPPQVVEKMANLIDGVRPYYTKEDE
jgi:hypothetical protein